MRETRFTVLTQGDVEMAHDVGYMVVGGDDAVCFFIDPKGRAFVEASTESPAGCGSIPFRVEVDITSDGR